MVHETALVATIASALALAFVFGFAARRVHLPPLVGYLVAGIAVGPFSPVHLSEPGIAAQLAEVGVILLMFGVGIHFSIRDLLAVRTVVVPGALIRIAAITALGALVARAWHWPPGAALVFGLSLSVASTVVLLRVLEERDELTTLEGHVAVGWLVVEDMATVLVLVLLPALAAPLGGAPLADGNVFAVLGLTLVEVTAFVLVMLQAGTRIVPRLLAAVARTGSRELFSLSVLALALGIAAGAAMLFGVSFALGAFFAGVVIAESDVSHQAAAEALPLRDAFAVLFFVSVGMVFDPHVLVERPFAVLATVVIATAAKALVAFVAIASRRYPLHTALTVSAGLAQIGEFSFIVAGLGVSLGLLPPAGESLVLAAAIASITLNPLAFRLVEPLERALRRRPRLLATLERRRGDRRAPGETMTRNGESEPSDHAVIVGYGRVGGTIGGALERQGIPFLVVEQDRSFVEHLRLLGVPVLFGDATRPGILEHAHLARARLLVIASPGAYQTRTILELARRLNPGIDTVVRTHSAEEETYLERAGVGTAVMGERELALGMARYALARWHTEPGRIEAVLHAERVAPAAHALNGASPSRPIPGPADMSG